MRFGMAGMVGAASVADAACRAWRGGRRALGSQQQGGHFGKAVATLGFGHVNGQVAHGRRKAGDVGDADAVGAVREHGFVVGGVADIHPLRQLVGQGAAPELAHDPLRALPFVVLAKPAVDVDGADGGVHARFLHQAHDVGDVLLGQLGEFAVVDGDVALAPGRIGGELGTGHGGGDVLGQRLHAREVVRAHLGALLVELGHAPISLAHEGDSAVFGQQGIERPLLGVGRAPARRAAGDGDQAQAARTQGVQGVQRAGHDVAVAGEGVVDIGHHALDGVALRQRPLFQGAHHGAGGWGFRHGGQLFLQNNRQINLPILAIGL